LLELYGIIKESIQAALDLPQIQSVAVLSEDLAYHPRLKFTSVRKFARLARLGEVKCVDIGRYEIISGKFKGLKVINSKLRELWPHVQSTPDEYNPEQVLQALRNRWHIKPGAEPFNFFFLASQTSFRLWVSLYERWAARPRQRRCGFPGPANGIEPNPAFEAVGTYLNALFSSNNMEMIWKDVRTVPLHKLGSQSDTVVLEWASEFLASNIELLVYRPASLGYMGEQLVKPHWAELERCGISPAQAMRLLGIKKPNGGS
jgi:hypothetical protein